MEGGEAGDLKYQRWKDVAPVIYDWVTLQNLTWPSLSCRWGHQTYKNKQQIYVSEQTDGSVPNTLVVATVQVVKPRTSSADYISKFGEERGSNNLTKHKTIVHPGEVNRIRELPQNSSIVATHSDVPEVYIWNLESQPNQRTTRGTPSPAVADLVLEGHTADAPFALAMSPAAPYVASGGTDCKVVLWSIEDHTTSLEGGSGASGTARKASRRKSSAGMGTLLQARSIFTGHTATVEDVCFHPSSFEELCSVGDDKSLLIWDARTSTSAPVLQVLNAHDDDVHCVDWSTHDTNLILTGSADHSVKLFDRRRMGGTENVAVHTFQQHTGPVLCVQWHPETAAVFGSCAEDGIVNCWNYEQIGKGVPKARFGTEDAEAPVELFFQHRGHRTKVVDFHWNPLDPWIVMSSSDDAELERGGGTIQIWKMNEVVYKGGDAEKAELLESALQISAAATAAAAAKAKAVDAKRKPPPTVDEEDAAPEPAKKTKLDVDVAKEAVETATERGASGTAPEPSQIPELEAKPQAPAVEESAAPVVVDETKTEESAPPVAEDGPGDIEDPAAPMEGVEAVEAVLAPPAEDTKIEEAAPAKPEEAPQPMDTAEGNADSPAAPVEDSAVAPEASAVAEETLVANATVEVEAAVAAAEPVAAPATKSAPEENGITEEAAPAVIQATLVVVELEAKAAELSEPLGVSSESPAAAVVEAACPEVFPSEEDGKSPVVEEVEAADPLSAIEENGGSVKVPVAGPMEQVEFAVPLPEESSAEGKIADPVIPKSLDVVEATLSPVEG